MPALTAGAPGTALPLHMQHALDASPLFEHTLSFEPPNADIISDNGPRAFLMFRRSLSHRPSMAKRLSMQLVGGLLLLHARRTASGGRAEVEGVDVETRLPTGADAVVQREPRCGR